MKARCAATILTTLTLAACGGGNGDNVGNAGNGNAGADAGERVMAFTDVTASSGIDLTTTGGRKPSTQIVEVKGGGLALIDVDADGDLDVFVPNGATLDDPSQGPGCRLYENTGDMTFRDATAESGLDFDRWGMGVAVGDVDGDGHDDIYIACFGVNALYRSHGDGTFEDVTESAGVGDPRWGTGCAFGDLDGDGDLDLYVVNYVAFDPENPPRQMQFKQQQVLGGPMGLPGLQDVVFENLGDGTFRDATDRWGFRMRRAAYGLGVAILDFDGDADQDVLVGNDSMPNFYFRNDGDGRFVETALRAGIAASGDGFNQATMGIAIADVSGSGFPDVFTTNFSSDTNTLHLNADGAFFDDGTQRWGLGIHSRPYLGWASGFFDFDLDGDEDLFVVNGHVYPNATPATMDSSYEQTPLLYRRGERRFERVEAAEAGAWLDERHCDRAAAFGDLDRDGDVDIVVAELNGPIRVLRNDATGRGIVVALRDGRAGSKNPRGLGARIELTAGDVVMRRWLFGGGSFQSASAVEAAFGVPENLSSATVRVVWPDGVEHISEIELDQRRVEIVRSE